MASSNGHTESADTTGTGIETVEVKDGSTLEARVGNVEGDDDRGVLGWAAFDELCKTVDAVESRVVDRVSKVEGVLAKIGPIESFIAEAQALADRMTIVERLVAAQVDKPATVNVRSDAASTVEAATEAPAVDEGWREMLQAIDNGLVYDPTADWFVGDAGVWKKSRSSGTRFTDEDTQTPSAWQAKTIATCPPPPNLAEWYKPGAKGDTLESVRGDARAAEAAWELAQDTIVQIRKAVPKVYDIPGTDVVQCVRNLASAHDAALKDMAEYRKAVEAANTNFARITATLAAAHEAARQAEGRAATSTKRATAAESELADLRAKVENLRAAFSG